MLSGLTQNISGLYHCITISYFSLVWCQFLGKASYWVCGWMGRKEGYMTRAQFTLSFLGLEVSEQKLEIALPDDIGLQQFPLPTARGSHRDVYGDKGHKASIVVLF